MLEGHLGPHEAHPLVHRFERGRRGGAGLVGPDGQEAKELRLVRAEREVPLAHRVKLVAGDNVLILGATGVTGKLAVRIAKLLGSGMAIMSDSSIGLKPVIEDPSNPIPPSKASSSSDELMENDFSWPSTSVNQRRMNRTSLSRTAAMTSVVDSAISRISLSVTASRTYE